MLRTLPTIFYLLLFFGLVVGNISVYRAIFAPQVLTMTVLNVGPANKQSNAVLVQSPRGETILIDTGPDASILRALGTTLPPWQRTIDLVVLTSTKKVIVGGLPDVLSRYKVSHQITITESKRLSFGEGSYVDIVVSPNATTTVSVTQ